MSEVSVNGVKLHYRTAGEGFPVVLIHGHTGNYRNWTLQVPALTQRYRTVSPDLRGHGLSDRPDSSEAYDIPLLAEDVLALLRELAVEGCYLVGHSLGGMVAQEMVLRRPSLFAALVLVDTSPGVPDGSPEELAHRQTLGRMALEQGMEAVFEYQNGRNPQVRVWAQQYPQVFARLREQFLMTSPRAFVHCMEAVARWQHSAERLRAISVPTLIVCGETDAPFLARSREMQGQIAGSELFVVPGAGHAPNLEAAPVFNEKLLEFLGRADARRGGG